MRTYHRSPDPRFSTITESGLFDGVFTCETKGAIQREGYLFVVESPRPLTAYALQYEISGAWAVALDVARGDEQKAEAILDPHCPHPDAGDGDEGWDYQRLRGVLAARLGYTSVEMHDECGTTWLCLQGCTVSACEEGAAESPELLQSIRAASGLTLTHITMSAAYRKSCYAELAFAEAALTNAGLALAAAVLKSTKMLPTTRALHLRHITAYITEAKLCVSEGPEVLGELSWKPAAHKTAASLWTAMFLAAERVIFWQAAF